MKGVIFDVDGTLVDNACFHTVAWLRACREMGLSVPSEVLHRHLGMGSDQFVPAVFGREVEGLADLHAEKMKAFDGEAEPFAGAADLLHELCRRGYAVGVATSASVPEAESHLRALLGDLSPIAALATADDVANTKPAPDLVAVAVSRLGVDVADLRFIGDTGWDGAAAAKCGVQFVGVKTGGWTADDLREMGAAEVFESVTDILGQLDEFAPGVVVTAAR